MCYIKVISLWISYLVRLFPGETLLRPFFLKLFNSHFHASECLTKDHSYFKITFLKPFSSSSYFHGNEPLNWMTVGGLKSTETSCGLLGMVGRGCGGGLGTCVMLIHRHHHCSVQFFHNNELLKPVSGHSEDVLCSAHLFISPHCPDITVIVDWA